MKIESLAGRSAIGKIKPLWEELNRHSFPHLCDSFNWHYTALQSAGRRAEPRLLLFHDHDEMTGILPLQRSYERFSRVPVRRYQFWEQSVNMSAIMLPPERAADALSLLLRNRRKLLRGMQVLKICARGDTSRQIRQFFLNHRTRLPALAAGKISYRLLAQDEPELHRQLQQHNMVSKHRRMLQRLKRAGEVSISHFCPVQLTEQAEEIHRRFLQLYRTSWKHHSPRSLSANSHEQAFFNRLYTLFASREQTTASFMQLNGRDIAANISLLHHDVWHGIQMAHDEQFKKLSPGNVLLTETLHALVRNKPLAFDFMGQHDYKRRLSNAADSYTDYYIFNDGPYSRLLTRLARWSAIPFERIN